MGAFSNLGGGTHIVVLTPRSARTTAEVQSVVETELLARVGAGPFRAGNVEHVQVLQEEAHEERLVVLFRVDIGTSPSLHDALAAVEKVARTRIVASAGRTVATAG